MRIVSCLAAALLAFGCAYPVTPEPSAGEASRYRLTRATTPGPLFLVGGTDAPAPFARAFVEMAGGPKAAIVLVPFAGGPQQSEPFRRALSEAGATVTVLHGEKDRLAAERAEIRRADGLFFSGGLPEKLLDALPPYLEDIKAAWQAGVAVGGNSAGAMIWGERVIVRGEADGALRHGLDAQAGGVALRAGAALLPGTIVDPHFTERSRFYRLFLGARAHRLLGLGIDPDTALALDADGALAVSGGGGVTLLAPAGPEARVRVLVRGESASLDHWR